MIKCKSIYKLYIIIIILLLYNNNYIYYKHNILFIIYNIYIIHTEVLYIMYICPPYSWVLHLQIQPTTDQKYWVNKAVDCVCTEHVQALYSIDIVFSIMHDLEMI